MLKIDLHCIIEGWRASINCSTISFLITSLHIKSNTKINCTLSSLNSLTSFHTYSRSRMATIMISIAFFLLLSSCTCRRWEEEEEESNGCHCYSHSWLECVWNEVRELREERLQLILAFELICNDIIRKVIVLQFIEARHPSSITEWSSILTISFP